jgi:hypothetical protein
MTFFSAACGAGSSAGGRIRLFRQVLTMKRLLPIFLVGSLLVARPVSGPSETKVRGVLIDQHCSYKAETRIVPGSLLEGGIIVAYTHTRQCDVMPQCRRSGFGVFTYDDNKFLAFDAAGNRKALEIFKAAGKDDDFRVEVTGTVEGDVIRVANIRPLM